jgi:hypothetical protein
LTRLGLFTVGTMPGVNSVAKSSLCFFSLRRRRGSASPWLNHVQFVDRFSVATGLEQVKIGGR